MVGIKSLYAYKKMHKQIIAKTCVYIYINVSPQCQKISLLNVFDTTTKSVQRQQGTKGRAVNGNKNYISAWPDCKSYEVDLVSWNSSKNLETLWCKKNAQSDVCKAIIFVSHKSVSVPYSLQGVFLTSSFSSPLAGRAIRTPNAESLDTMMDFLKISAPSMASNSHLQKPRQMM